MAPQATLICGDVIDVLDKMPEKSVHTIITSPPYYGLRDYGIPPRTWEDGSVCCLGLEPTRDLFIAHLVEVFRHAKRVLRDDGTLWLNLGDSYAGGGRHDEPTIYKAAEGGHKPVRAKQKRLTGKDLLMVPARAAIALQDDGWVLRQDNVWAKGLSFCEAYSGSVMPESTRDRTTWAHEHIFHLAKRKELRRTIQLSDLSNKIVKLGDNARLSTPDVWGNKIAICTATAILDRSKLETQFSLSSLDSDMREKHLQDSGSSLVSSLPSEQGPLSQWAMRFLNREISAKVFLEQLKSLVANLRDSQPLMVIGIPISHFSSPEFYTNGDTTITVEDSGYVCEFNIVSHSFILTGADNHCQPYFYDIDAGKEPYADSTVQQTKRPYTGQGRKAYREAGVQNPSDVKRRVLDGAHTGTGRNLRNVWVIGKEAFKGAHFATFPTKLVTPIIKLATAETGCCATCGAPRVRTTRREAVPETVQQAFNAARMVSAGHTGRTDGHTQRKPHYRREVLGTEWHAGCQCDAESVPCTVMDLFSGSGRCGVAAVTLGRDYIGIDLKSEYHAMAKAALTEAGADVQVLQ